VNKDAREIKMMAERDMEEQRKDRKERCGG
jgi:hypothetical protein